MKIALDTNSYSRYIDEGDENLKLLLERAELVAMPVIVLAELKYGFLFGSQQGKNTLLLQKFLADSRVVILPIDQDTTEQYAQLAAQLRRQGTPIPTNDLWIAALVTQYDYPLATNDAHFDYLASLPRASL